MQSLSCRSPIVARRLAASGIFWITVEQLDRDTLRPAEEANLDPRPWRMWFLGELDALLSEVGRDCIDAGDGKAEMIETLIRRDWRRIDAVAGIDLRQKDHGAAKLDVYAWLALLRRADHLGVEHSLEPLRGGIRIGRAQVNMIPLIVWHCLLRSGSASLRRAECRAQQPCCAGIRSQTIIKSAQ